jgi:predicted RNA-binding Zn-ribbon protein involved in translation (DUF1610 family)
VRILLLNTEASWKRLAFEVLCPECGEVALWLHKNTVVSFRDPSFEHDA